MVSELEPTPAVLLSRRLDLLVWNPSAFVAAVGLVGLLVAIAVLIEVL